MNKSFLKGIKVLLVLVLLVSFFVPVKAQGIAPDIDSENFSQALFGLGDITPPSRVIRYRCEESSVFRIQKKDLMPYLYIIYTAPQETSNGVPFYLNKVKFFGTLGRLEKFTTPEIEISHQNNKGVIAVYSGFDTNIVVSNATQVLGCYSNRKLGKNILFKGLDLLGYPSDLTMIKQNADPSGSGFLLWDIQTGSYEMSPN